MTVPLGSTPLHVSGTTPYPWPWNGDCTPARTALVITGWDPHWMAATRPDTAVLANIATLATVLPFTITVTHRPPRRTTITADAVSRVRLPDLGCDDLVAVDAAGVDGFWGSPLDALVRERGLDRLVLVGLGLETTVHSTLRRANDMGLECLLVVDACAPVDPTLVQNAVSSIEMSGGIFGAGGTTDAVRTAFATPDDPNPPPATSPLPNRTGATP